MKDRNGIPTLSNNGADRMDSSIPAMGDEGADRPDIKQSLERRISDLQRENEQLRRSIDECKRVEEALRKSEEKYKELAEMLPQVVCEVDAQGNFTFMNCAGLQAVGYTWKEISEKLKVIDLFIPGDRERIARSMRRVLDGEKLRGAEYTVLRSDGSTFPVLVHSSRIVRNNRAVGIRGVVVDITDLRRAQEKLWLKNSAIASSIDAIAIATREGNLSYVNPSFLKMWDYDRAKNVLGRHAREFWQTPAKADDIVQILTVKGYWLGELVARRRDGSFFNAQVSASMVTDETGKPVCMMASVIDITDRKRAESELLQRTGDLADRVRELNCLYAVSNVCERQDCSLDEIVQRIVDLVPSAWRYPEIICTRAILEGREFRTRNFRKTRWRLEAEITLRGRRIGTVEVAYLHEKPQEVDGPFLNEERKLLDVVAETLGTITEAKLAEQALRESEARFRAIFESALDCILIKDQELRYTHVNPAVEKLLGREASQILGRKAGEIFGPKAGKRLREVGLRALNGEWVEEEHTRTVQGRDLCFHEITVPLRNPEGNTTGTCTISRDVTERKKVQSQPPVSVREYRSKAMRSTMEKARFAAARDSIVLLCGESGCGKDFVARWIHDHSRRARGPFFAVNCAALPHELAESELFGHEPGAFTGANFRKRGMLELGEGGTILLNEIGELSLPLQSKLLSFLDTRAFLRVGGEKNIHINARLIAATHRELENEVRAGRFLEALFYRLNVFTVRVPALRERKEDIPILVDEIMVTLATEMQLTEIPVTDSQGINTLQQYPWPGNVRELRNVLERSLILWDKGRFTLALPVEEGPVAAWSHQVAFPVDRSLRQVRAEITASLCSEALRRAGGSKTEAARLLGISRYSLYRYMKGYPISGENVTAT